MTYTVQINNRKNTRDQHGEHVKHDIADAGLTPVAGVNYHPLYRIDGDLTRGEIDEIASRLLIDPVTQSFSVNEGGAPDAGAHSVEVWLKHGVTDTVAESVVKAVRDLGIGTPIAVKTGHRYVFAGDVKRHAVEQIAARLLVNPMIQEFKIQ